MNLEKEKEISTKEYRDKLLSREFKRHKIILKSIYRSVIENNIKELHMCEVELEIDLREYIHEQEKMLKESAF